MTKPVDTRVSKNALNFGRVRMYRSDRVPRMDEGRNGDLAIIDTTRSTDDPGNVGLWMKIPLSDDRAPRGTVITGIPGRTSDTSTLIINTITVTLSNPANIDKIVSDINDADIPNIIALEMGDAVQIIELAGGAITISDNSMGLYSTDPLSVINTQGVWLPFRISGSNTYATRAISAFIETPAQKTYVLLGSAVQLFNIVSLAASTGSGSVDVELRINGTPVVGLSITATTAKNIVYATMNNSVSFNDEVDIITSNNSGATDLSITVGYQYREA